MFQDPKSRILDIYLQSPIIKNIFIMKLTLARDNGDISTMRMLGINLQMEAAELSQTFAAFMGSGGHSVKIWIRFTRPDEYESSREKKDLDERRIRWKPFLSIRPASISCPQASGWLRSYTLTSTVCSTTPKKTGKACYWRHPAHHLNFRCLNEGLGKRKNRIDHRRINGRDICFLFFQVLSDSNNSK